MLLSSHLAEIIGTRQTWTQIAKSGWLDKYKTTFGLKKKTAYNIKISEAVHLYEAWIKKGNGKRGRKAKARFDNKD